jgi:XTP/dITP diphosphohydrolase
MSKMVLLVATHNQGKRREYSLLLKEFPIEIKGLSDFQKIPKFEEKGSTFDEIAREKARFASRMLHVPALADDSGLVVEALDGAPGTFSARYAGNSADDYQNNLKLVKNMNGREKRDATFVCCIAIAKPGGQVLTYTGRCSGRILRKPIGTHGFGYDALFYYPPLRKTFAQLTPEEKNRVSHRGKAMRRLANDFENMLAWLEDQ